MLKKLITFSIYLGLYACDNTSSDHLTFVLKDILDTNNLPLSKCRGQNYDGASAMQGSKNGLKTQILKEENRAIAIWCYAHNVNLASCDSMKKCQIMKNSFSTNAEIVKTIRWSPKRNARLNAIKAEVETEVCLGLNTSSKKLFSQWQIDGLFRYMAPKRYFETTFIIKTFKSVY